MVNADNSFFVSWFDVAICDSRRSQTYVDYTSSLPRGRFGTHYSPFEVEGEMKGLLRREEHHGGGSTSSWDMVFKPSARSRGPLLSIHHGVGCIPPHSWREDTVVIGYYSLWMRGHHMVLDGLCPPCQRYNHP